MSRTTPSDPEQPATAADALLRALEADGVEVVFGLPGGAISPVHDAMMDSKLREAFDFGSVPIKLPHSLRDRHCYLIGRSGSGKTNLIRVMAMHSSLEGDSA